MSLRANTMSDSFNARQLKFIMPKSLKFDQGLMRQRACHIYGVIKLKNNMRLSWISVIVILSLQTTVVKCIKSNKSSGSFDCLSIIIS